MATLAIDHDPGLSETERAAYETAHRFARDVLRPAGEKLDKLPAADVIARDSISGMFSENIANSASACSMKTPRSTPKNRRGFAASSARNSAGATAASPSASALQVFPR